MSHALLRARKLGARHPHFGKIHIQRDARRYVAHGIADLDGLAERPLGVVPAGRLGVQQADIVQRNGDIFREAERAVLGETRLVVALRLQMIAAHVGNHSEILRSHGGELCISRPQRPRARGQVEPLRFIKFPELPLHDRHPIDGVTAGRLVTPRFCRGFGSGKTIHGRVHIRVTDIRARNPAQCTRGLTAIGLANGTVQRQLVQAPRLGARAASFRRLSVREQCIERGCVAVSVVGTRDRNQSQATSCGHSPAHRTIPDATCRQAAARSTDFFFGGRYDLRALIRVGGAL